MRIPVSKKKYGVLSAVRAARRQAACIFTAVLLLGGIFYGAGAEADSISAKAYLVMEASCGQVTAAQNEREKLPIASTTKIMTAYLALQQPELYETFTVDKNAITVEGTSMGLVEGDTVTLYDLACGMLLASGNDAANAAAVYIGGSIAGFVDMMNDKARQLGMNNTHFANPSGLPDDTHYSTAYDMAILAAAALKEPLFLEICSSVTKTVTISGQKRSYRNHNRLLCEYEGCIGVKTGFTKKAGRCLVSAAERDGVTLICVTLSAPDDWNDHKKLLDAGFAAVQRTELIPKEREFTVKVAGGEQETVNAYVFGKLEVCLTEEESRKITQQFRMRAFYFAPVYPGQVLGQVRYYYQDRLLGVQLVLADGGCAYREWEE